MYFLSIPLIWSSMLCLGFINYDKIIIKRETDFLHLYYKYNVTNKTVCTF